MPAGARSAPRTSDSPRLSERSSRSERSEFRGAAGAREHRRAPPRSGGQHRRARGGRPAPLHAQTKAGTGRPAPLHAPTKARTPENQMSEISGGELIARMLQKEGVEKVFGIIDGTYFGFYSALHRLGIEIVTPRHETSAAHMAGAYARVTGRLGVCMASNGPGVANLLPGLVVEQAEGNRVLAITSARRVGIAGPDRPGAYQSFDQSGVIARMAKSSVAVPGFERIGEIVRKALRRSWEGRPGVVHVDVPESLMNGKFKDPGVPLQEPTRYRRAAPVVAAPEQVARAAQLLIRASAPAIHAGSGVVHAGAFAALQRVAEAAARAGHHQLGRPRGVAGDLAAGDPDGPHQTQPHAAQRGRRDADRRLARRRDRLVGQAAVLAQSGRADDDPGRRRRRRARHEPAGRPRDRRRRARVPRATRRRTGAPARRDPPGRATRARRALREGDARGSRRTGTRRSPTSRCR